MKIFKRFRMGLDAQVALFAVLALALCVFFHPAGVAGIPAMGLGVGLAGMIIDANLQFASATALGVAGTGLQLVGNVIDTTTVRDLGNGRPLYLVVIIDTTVLAAGGASTVQFILASDSVAAIHTDGTAVVHAMSPAIPKATLVKGYVAFVCALPWQGVAYKEFLGLLVDVETNAATAGKIDAFLTMDPSKWAPYAAAI